MGFDIILPTIGRPSLSVAIQSILAQEYQYWNLFVVRDRWEGEDGIPMNDDRIHTFGVDGGGKDYGAFARNAGITLPIGSKIKINDWIAYIDDDDTWLPHHLLVLSAYVATGATMIRTAGQSFKLSRRSPRSSERRKKLGPVNSTDVLTVGMAHTRELYGKTRGWQSCDNHDHILWADMLAAGGQPRVSEAVTFQFER
jgi:glycosyltransferase involved in cell wall biosynthesis